MSAILCIWNMPVMSDDRFRFWVEDFVTSVVWDYHIHVRAKKTESKMVPLAYKKHYRHLMKCDVAITSLFQSVKCVYIREKVAFVKSWLLWHHAISTICSHLLMEKNWVLSCWHHCANDLYMIQLMPLSPRHLCFSRIQNDYPSGNGLPTLSLEKLLNEWVVKEKSGNFLWLVFS